MENERNYEVYVDARDKLNNMLEGDLCNDCYFATISAMVDTLTTVLGKDVKKWVKDSLKNQKKR